MDESIQEIRVGFEPVLVKIFAARDTRSESELTRQVGDIEDGLGQDVTLHQFMVPPGTEPLPGMSSGVPAL